MKILELKLKKKVIIVDLPEDYVSEFSKKKVINTLIDSQIYIHSKLGDTIEFLSLGSELTEENVSELVEKGKNSYGELKYENHYDDIGSFMGYDYALPSFISAVESKGFYWLENPYDKLINVNPNISSSMVKMVNRINYKEQWIESEEKTFRNPLIFVKK